MPVYSNPNNHPVAVSLTHPHVSVTVFPSAWQPSRLPKDAKRTIELDETLARQFVAMGMLAPVPVEAKPALTRESVTAVVQEAARQGLASVMHQETHKVLTPSSLSVEERPMDAPAAAPPASSSQRRKRYSA
jgi:hypothetical protein